MPRRAAHNSEESPVPRRTSARIAAVQAASPAKSPMKSPRRKRQSTEATKATSEDTESQQSHVKSEGSFEELNGLETGSSTKDRDSVVDLQELPPKKAKVDEQAKEGVKEVSEQAVDVPSQEARLPSTDVISVAATDFEVVEKTDVPPADSDEVKAAISVQGEDGQLLVGFVQVDKDELPSATSLEVKRVAPSEQPEGCTVESKLEALPALQVPAPVNGDSEHASPAPVSTESFDVSDHRGNAALETALSSQRQIDQLSLVPESAVEACPEVKHLASEMPKDITTECTTHNAPTEHGNAVASLYSDAVKSFHSDLSDYQRTESELQNKVPVAVGSAVQPLQTPAAGDGTVVDAISLEVIPQ